MEKTRQYKITENTILVDTFKLREVLNSGRATAVKIGKNAGAEVRIGRRVLWNLSKIQEYIDKISL